MKIKESHIDEAFGRLEDYAIRCAKSSKERQSIIFAASRMKDILTGVIRAKSEKDLELSRVLGGYFVDILKKQDGDLLSFKYRCGHNINPVIINTTVRSLEIYTEWKNDHSDLCIECWMGKRNVGRHGDKKGSIKQKKNDRDNRNMKVKIRSLKVPRVHFKNPRTGKTLCGHIYTIPGRSYSNVTSNLDDVSCPGCKNSIKASKWIKKMISEKNKVHESPREVVDRIMDEVAKSS